MRGLIANLLLIFGKKAFGQVYKKILVLVILLIVYFGLGFALRLTWKSFKKKYIPFLGK